MGEYGGWCGRRGAVDSERRIELNETRVGNRELAGREGGRSKMVGE